MAVDLDNLGTFYAGLAMKMALELPALLMHGLKAAVENGKAGADINAAASAWVAKGYLEQADADAIAALAAARDAAPEEPEPEEPEEPTEPEEGGE